ncbi:MAG: AAA family ATPase [Actinomycetales bacterium]
MVLAAQIGSPEALADCLATHDYLTEPGLATALFCAVRLPQPLLLEGEAGVGKTQAAKALAATLDTPLIRLQCFEGIDASEALYEWNYPRQLLGIRLAEAKGHAIDERSLFTRDYLIERPLLQALEHPGPNPAVLLIDEVDRADEEFEAFLFELLAESTVTVPELGTLRATQPPVVVLTSNRTRDLHDALKRRCLYHWIEYPSLDGAIRILQLRAPQVSPRLAAEVAGAVERLRTLDLQKPPGVAEAIDWVHAAALLGVVELDETAVSRTLGSVLKYWEDQAEAKDRGLAWIAGD